MRHCLIQCKESTMSFQISTKKNWEQNNKLILIILLFWFLKIRNWFSRFVPILLSYVNYNASGQQWMMCWVQIGGPSISAGNVKPERIQKNIDSVSVSSNWGPHISRKKEQRRKTIENEDLSPSYGDKCGCSCNL